MQLENRHISHGYYLVTTREARELARQGPNGKLPNPGYECRVQVNGCPAWLTRTMANGKQVWAVRACYGYEIPMY